MKVCRAEAAFLSVELENRPLTASIREARLVAVSQSSTRTASKKLQTVLGTGLVRSLAYSRSWDCLAVTKCARSISIASPVRMQTRQRQTNKHLRTLNPIDVLSLF